MVISDGSLVSLCTRKTSVVAAKLSGTFKNSLIDYFIEIDLSYMIPELAKTDDIDQLG